MHPYTNSHGTIKYRYFGLTVKESLAPAESPLKTLETNLTLLSSLLASVDGLVKETKTATPERLADLNAVGRAVQRIVENVASVDGLMEGLVKAGVRDSLVAMYLANLTAAQVQVGEKLHKYEFSERNN